MYDAFITGVLYLSLTGLLLFGIYFVFCIIWSAIKLVSVAVKVAVKGVGRGTRVKS